MAARPLCLLLLCVSAPLRPCVFTLPLYACLSIINRPETKIITLEDPVEYQLDSVTQMQVNPQIEFTFAAGLRSIVPRSGGVGDSACYRAFWTVWSTSLVT